MYSFSFFEMPKVAIIGNTNCTLVYQITDRNFTYSGMIRYKCIEYKELTLDELYAIMKLRQEVFVVEQNCPYLDADGRDQLSFHVIGLDDTRALRSYTRICPPGVSYDGYVSIGRVVVHPDVRGSGEGYRLMRSSLGFCKNLYPELATKISAQKHLSRFYENLGYVSVGQGYLEDGIPHIAMIRS